jgi:hypothetical protein
VRVTRRLLAIAVFGLAIALCPQPASAQAPPSAPLVLRTPSSVRATALGDAWVAGRDADVIFYNPAQLIGVRQEFTLSLTRRGPGSTLGTFSSVYAAGKMSLTLGWGVKFASYSTASSAAYPYSPDVLNGRGPSAAFGMLATVGGAVVYKGFRIGAAGKYVTDRVPQPSNSLDTGSTSHHAFVADLGVAHSLFGGMAALGVQNLGPKHVDGTPQADLPRQVLAGWSRFKAAGPLDLGLFTQVTARHGWMAPAAGLEVGYSWIEGYSVTLRAGAHRPETAAERPVAVGGAFTADRLTFEYALQFFDNGRYAHGVTVRWR